MRFTATMTLCTLASCLGSPLQAGESYPAIEGSLSVEIQSDRTYKATDRNEERTDSYATIEPEFVVRMTPALSLVAAGTLEPVRDLRPGRDRSFEDHGFYLSDLFLVWEGDRWEMAGGKLTAPFGLAWDLAPGIYGTDFAEDYELAERLGLMAGLMLGNETYGAHAVRIAAFRLDNSALSQSIFTKRGRLDRDEGLPANTSKFSSVSLTIDGDLPMVEGLGYHLGAMRQARGGRGAVKTAKAETGFVAGLTHEWEMGEVTLSPLVEAVRIRDADGDDGVNRRYLTAGAGAEWGAWNAALSGTRRSTSGSETDRLLQLSAGYTFSTGIGLDLGWRYARENGDRFRTIGALLSYDLEF